MPKLSTVLRRLWRSGAASVPPLCSRRPPSSIVRARGGLGARAAEIWWRPPGHSGEATQRGLVGGAPSRRWPTGRRRRGGGAAHAILSRGWGRVRAWRVRFGFALRLALPCRACVVVADTRAPPSPSPPVSPSCTLPPPRLLGLQPLLLLHHQLSRPTPRPPGAEHYWAALASLAWRRALNAGPTAVRHVSRPAYIWDVRGVVPLVCQPVAARLPRLPRLRGGPGCGAARGARAAVAAALALAAAHRPRPCRRGVGF